METLEGLRRQLGTATELLTLVRTMKAMAAVTLHSVDAAVTSAETCRQAIELGLQAFLKAVPPVPPPLLPGAGRLGILACGSDIGLCGSFNESTADFTLEARLPGASRVIAVGDRLGQHLAALGEAPQRILPAPATVDSIPETVYELLLEVDAWRKAAAVDRVLLVYHIKDDTRTSSHLVRPQLLPVDAAWWHDLADRPWQSRSAPRLFDDAGRVLATLLQQHFFASIFAALVHSIASENGARLLAMEAAEQNIARRLETLRQDSHRLRQEQVTEELLTIGAGYGVLTGT